MTLVEYPPLAAYAARYADTANYRPFAVRATLAQSTPVGGYDPPQLDALLTWCVVQEAVPEGRLPDAKPGYRLPVPLKALGHYGPHQAPLWAATPFSPLGDSVVDVHYWHKRGQRGEYTGTKSGEFSITATKGRYMDRRVPLPSVLARHWLATGIGDPEEVLRLLRRVTHLGKRRANGFGAVERWEVCEMQDWSLAGEREGREILLRSLPQEAVSLLPACPEGEAALCAWTPTYWNPALFAPGWREGTPLEVDFYGA